MYWQTNLNPADFFKNDIELELTHHSGKISYSLLEMKVVTSMMMRCLNVLVSAYLIDSYLELLSNLFFFFFLVLFSLSDPVMAQLRFLSPLQQNALMVLFILEIWEAIPTLRSTLLFRMWNEFIVAQVQTRRKEIGVLWLQVLSFECVIYLVKNLVSLRKIQIYKKRLSLQLDLPY